MVNQHAKRFGLLSLLLLFLSPALASAAVDAPMKYVLCKNRKAVRTIRVDKEQDGTCKTKYTKSGEDRVVGFGVRENTCAGFLENIQSNLEQTAWKCRDISSAKIYSDSSLN